MLTESCIPKIVLMFRISNGSAIFQCFLYPQTCEVKSIEKLANVDDAVVRKTL